MVSVLLTGGAGYVGSTLVGHLLANPEFHKVTVFDNLTYGYASLLSYLKNPCFHFIKGDVRNKTQFKPLVESHDVIISLAALVGAQLCDQNPMDANAVNLEANKNICDWNCKDQKLIFPNTNSGLGATDGQTVCTEETPMNPVSLYGRTKVQAERYIKNFENFISMRLATVFGSSLRPRTDLLVNNLVWKAYKERCLVLYEHGFMRNYIHIDDVCRAICFVLKYWDQCKNQVYNVGNDDLNMNKLQLAQKINEHISIEIIKAEISKDKDKRNYIVSSKKFYDKGFQCEYDLDDGIKGLIKQYEMIDCPVNANY